MIEIGLQSENSIITYTETLLTSTNTKEINPSESSTVPEPHPFSLDITKINESELEKDYQEIINCCQRNVCRMTGYCKSSLSRLAGDIIS